MRKPILPATAIAVALLSITVVSAQAAQWMTDPNASGDIVVKDDAGPLAPQSITQNLDPYTIVDGTSVACISAIMVEHGYWRLFDLDGDHGLTGQFCVESVDWAIQSVVGGTAELTVNVYCLDEGLPFLMQHLTLQDSGTVVLTDQSLTFHNTAVGGCCDTASQDMAVELFIEDCYFTGCNYYFIGMNNLGQTAPTYIRSVSCGNVEPTDLASIGFPDAHLIMVVNGQDEIPPDDGGDPDVPATTGAGAVLLLLFLLGSGAYFLRRRAATSSRYVHSARG